MADAAILAPLMSSVVGLVGVLVAGLSVYFNYRGRHNQFRQVVYSKQMDGYFEIVGAMANLHNAAQNLINFGGFRAKDADDAQKRFHTALREEHDQFIEKVNRWLIVLPSKVKAALDSFNASLWSLNIPHTVRHDAEPVDADDPGAELARAYERAVNCIRYHLAVDSLTMGMMREMGIGTDTLSVRGMTNGAVRLVTVGPATSRSGRPVR
jgi:hypothetical protein